MDFYLLYVYTPSRRQVTSPQTQMPSEAARQLKLTEHFDQVLLQSTTYAMLQKVKIIMEVALSGIWGQKLVIKTSIALEINGFC